MCHMRRRIHVMKASVDIKCWDTERRGIQLRLN